HSSPLLLNAQTSSPSHSDGLSRRSFRDVCNVKLCRLAIQYARGRTIRPQERVLKVCTLLASRPRQPRNLIASASRQIRRESVGNACLAGVGRIPPSENGLIGRWACKSISSNTGWTFPVRKKEGVKQKYS